MNAGGAQVKLVELLRAHGALYYEERKTKDGKAKPIMGRRKSKKKAKTAEL